jgi:hypothetical protein
MLVLHRVYEEFALMIISTAVQCTTQTYDRELFTAALSCSVALRNYCKVPYIHLSTDTKATRLNTMLVQTRTHP